MNKKFKNLFLAGALALGLAGVAVSCTDYSKDIDELRDENAELKSTVKALQDKLDAGLSIKSVTPVTDGFTITFSDGSSYTIKNGKDGNDGNDGDKGDNGYFKYYVPGENGLWIEYSTENPDGKETTISCLPSASGAVTAKLSKDGKTLTLSGLEGTDGDFVLSLKAELSSLVFVPELYVDGVAATEYTYFEYDARKGINASAATGTIVSDNGAKYNLPASVATGAWWDYDWDGDKEDQIINPVFPVSYKLNPSNADITDATYAFVCDDKEFIVTRGSKAAPEVGFVSAKEGVLTVGLKANGPFIAESESTGSGSSLNHANSGLSVFALQAKVGEDSIVTSDFAALYASWLDLTHLVVTETVNSDEYTACQDEYKLFTEAKKAIEAAPGLQVAYNKTLDLDEIVTSHVDVCSKSSRAARDVEFGDFCESVGIEPLDYINYKYELIDYTVGSYTTSQSQHASLVEGHIFTPCAVTADGKRDVSNRDVTSVGRKPLVRVTLEDKATGNVILVGFIKIEIVKNSDYDLAKKFEKTFKFECFTQEWNITWGEVIENVLRRSGEASSSHEEFVTNYEFDRIDHNPDNVARQYVLANGEFRPASESSEYLGEVRILNEWRASSATTNVFSWILDDSELSWIYKQKEHTYTIYVRFVPTPGAVNKYDGIYVPLTVTVTKPSGSVGVKLDANWYDGGTKARLNVNRPVQSADNRVQVTPWTVDLNSVWATNPNYYDEPANSPVFNAPKDANGYLYKSFTDVIFGHQYGNVNTNHSDGEGGYKFYFAPVQDKFVAKDGTEYQLYVKDTKIYDAYLSGNTEGVDFKTIKANSRISVVEDTLSADVTKGIYTNNKLLCKVGSIEYTIATIDQTDGEVTWNINDISSKLLNEYSCANRADAKLFAHIGVVAYSPCGVAMSATGNVDEYHFLRPLNVDGVNTKAFIDGDNAAGAGSNLDVFDLLKFSDWRYDESQPSSAEIANFVNYDEDGTPDYSHLWYLSYYGVKKIKVDIDNITTDMSVGGTAGTLGTTKLADVTTDCRISYHNTGSYNNVSYSVTNNTVTLNYGGSVGNIPKHYSSSWNTGTGLEAAVNAARKQFGFIHYQNNNYNTVGATLRIPIEVTYAFGTISTYIDVKINDTI